MSFSLSEPTSLICSKVIGLEDAVSSGKICQTHVLPYMRIKTTKKVKDLDRVLVCVAKAELQWMEMFDECFRKSHSESC